MIKQINGITGAILGVAALVGVSFGAVNYFATAQDLKLVEMRLDQKIVSDRIQQLQERIWMLQDRYQKTSMPAEVKNEIRQLQMEIENLQRKLSKG